MVHRPWQSMISLSQPIRRWRIRRRQFDQWAAEANLWPKLEVGLAALTLIIGVGSYFTLSNQATVVRINSPHLLTWIIIANAIPLSIVAFLVVRRLTVLLANRRRGLAGSQLHIRLVGLFSMVAIIPTVLVVGFATYLFDSGLQFWFSDRVRTVLDNADQVAQAYVRENRDRIRGDLLAMAGDLSRQAPVLGRDVQAFTDVVLWQALARDLTEAIVFQVAPDRAMDVVSRISLDPNVTTARLPEDAVNRAATGNVVVIEGRGEDNNRVQALIRLDGYKNTFLYVSRKASPQVLDQVARTQSALSDYRQLVQRRNDLQLRFNIILVVISLLILLISMWAALWLANRLVAPIGRLVRAADRVGRGDLTVRVPVRGSPDEFGVLARAFNRMTTQLEAQTSALVAANTQLDQRRRFTEAVLSGVSAGVLGVSAEGRVTLPNRSAAILLETEEASLSGRPLSQVAPELAPLLDEARQSPDRNASGQIAVRRGHVHRTLMAQVSPETRGGELAGWVITFDDITQQLADQRRAAWSDVARRIAHEIKNPLTPIQLAAERLRRKYLKEIESDPQTFSNCTDTIIRQVGDLRRMVDEFSSFARMPKPVFQPEPALDIIRQALFLQEVAHTDVAFTLDAPENLPVMVCDRRQIGQALTNLIKNAVEGTQARRDEAGPASGYQPAIAVSARMEGCLLAIAIEDNGIGFPPELKNRLTEPYVTTRAKGTGLGLAIVKKIVEDHEGALELRDRPEGGGDRIPAVRSRRIGVAR
ncbi:sensor histidine kinase NtrY-like [Pedomonas mirosovicensis]|uniref:sensor histidine kinase NtrY-like n=1 Tax=Pedomonas mirosovicensis TaxID=2908641 RepID=UPI00216A7960|nr:PAS domain-containing sensor histidine kinase [Pedomonas mirosovicensis]MCH8685257.1 PAS domain-containing sensor histidine kinase [Pedomonas mirosovicensis]